MTNEDGLLLLQEFCKHLDFKGGGSWAPVRAAAFPSDQWGRWECWEYAKFGELHSGAVGAIRTGDWIAWDSQTGGMLGFPSRKAAEIMAVLQNEGAATRAG